MVFIGSTCPNKYFDLVLNFKIWKGNHWWSLVHWPSVLHWLRQSSENLSPLQSMASYQLLWYSLYIGYAVAQFFFKQQKEHIIRSKCRKSILFNSEGKNHFTFLHTVGLVNIQTRRLQILPETSRHSPWFFFHIWPEKQTVENYFFRAVLRAAVRRELWSVFLV